MSNYNHKYPIKAGPTEKRITLIISSLGSGGAERVLSTLANHWASQGNRVNVITFDGRAAGLFYRLHSAVQHSIVPTPGRSGRARQAPEHRAAGINSASSSRRPMLARLLGLGPLIYWLWSVRRAIQRTRPDVIISFTDATNIYTLLVTIGSKLPVIISERIDPRHHPIGRGWERLRRLTYPRAARLVVQTDAALSYFSPRVRHRGRVIPNPVSAPEDQSQPTSLLRGSQYGTPRVMAMGRLTDQKGFDVLLRAFARVAPTHPEWVLEIRGEGDLRGPLEALVEELGLSGKVTLPGRAQQPAEAMRRADLFVLSSRYEGFPNVLCEAMACGLPVISFDCPSGPSEIIRDGIDGVLVPPGDEAALAAAMARLMDHPEERERLAARAPEVLDRFSLEKVTTMWDEIIHEVRLRKVDRSPLLEMKGHRL